MIRTYIKRCEGALPRGTKRKQIRQFMRKDIELRIDAPLRQIRRTRPKLANRCGGTPKTEQTHLCEENAKNARMMPHIPPDVRNGPLGTNRICSHSYPPRCPPRIHRGLFVSIWGGFGQRGWGSTAGWRPVCLGSLLEEWLAGLRVCLLAG